MSGLPHSDNVGWLARSTITAGRWMIIRDGREPVELTSGDLFWVDVAGTLQVTRMEYRHLGDRTGEYYSVHGYRLFEGRRAAIASEARW